MPQQDGNRPDVGAAQSASAGRHFGRERRRIPAVHGIGRTFGVTAVDGPRPSRDARNIFRAGPSTVLVPEPKLWKGVQNCVRAGPKNGPGAGPCPVGDAVCSLLYQLCMVDVKYSQLIVQGG